MEENIFMIQMTNILI